MPVDWDTDLGLEEWWVVSQGLNGGGGEKGRGKKGEEEEE